MQRGVAAVGADDEVLPGEKFSRNLIEVAVASREVERRVTRVVFAEQSLLREDRRRNLVEVTVFGGDVQGVPEAFGLVSASTVKSA